MLVFYSKNPKLLKIIFLSNKSAQLLQNSCNFSKSLEKRVIELQLRRENRAYISVIQYFTLMANYFTNHFDISCPIKTNIEIYRIYNCPHTSNPQQVF